MKAFTVMWRTIKGAYDELFLVVALSLVFWAGTLLVVTAPMTWVGVNYVANRLANYRRGGFDFFWEGARQHVLRGVWLWLLVVLAPPSTEMIRGRSWLDSRLSAQDRASRG